MKRTRLIIIGIGKIGADLLQKLSREYELLCIDNAPARALTKDGRIP